MRGFKGPLSELIWRDIRVSFCINVGTAEVRAKAGSIMPDISVLSASLKWPPCIHACISGAGNGILRRALPPARSLAFFGLRLARRKRLREWGMKE